MGYWKTKVLPKIKKVFDTSNPKKIAAAEATKSFDESKEELNKEFEEKKADLQPKVIEIYEASSTDVKTLVKEPKEAGLKKNSTEVQKFLDELVKIEFPGSKQASEALSKFGSLGKTQVFYIFEKVSTFIVTEEVTKVEEKATEEAKAEEEVVATTTKDDQTAETSKDKEINIEEEKKEEKKEEAEPTKPVEEAKPVVEEAKPEPAKPVEEAKPEPTKP